MDDTEKLYVLQALDSIFLGIERERAIDPNARIDHFRAAIATAKLRITAVRAVVNEVLDMTDPSALEETIAGRAQALAAARERGLAVGKRILAFQNERDAAATLAALESDVQVAESIVARAEAAGSRQEAILARTALRETVRLRDEAAAKVAETAR